MVSFLFLKMELVRYNQTNPDDETNILIFRRTVIGIKYYNKSVLSYDPS